MNAKHEDLLRRLLSGEVGEADAEVAFSDSPDLAERWRELRRTAERIDAEAGERSASLKATERADGGPAEDALVAKFAAQVESLSRSTPKSTPPVEVSGRRSSRVVLAVLAAAAALAALIPLLGNRGERRSMLDRYGSEPIELGSVDEACRPAGPVASYGAFEWTLELPPGGRYELSVWARVDGREQLLVREELDAATWAPGAGTLPDRILWQVIVLDASGELTDETCSTECWRD